MKVINLFSVGLFAVSSYSQATTINPPFFAQPARTFEIGAPGSDASHRLRLILSSNEELADAGVALGNVTFCSKSACFRPSVPGQISLKNSSSGDGTIVADFEFAGEAVESIYFEQTAATHGVSGYIKLTSPVPFEAEYLGQEVVVILSKSTEKVPSYHPIGEADNKLREVGQTVLYNPKFATHADLPLGARITIPKNATAGPQIFNIAVHDIDSTYPLLDIYPVVKLSTPASVSVHRIAHEAEVISSTRPGRAPAPESVSPDGMEQRLSVPNSVENSTTIQINQTGVVRAQRRLGASPQIFNTAATAPGGWTNCADDLSFPANQQIITNGLTATGTEYINWCETIAPYVHIGITNYYDSRELFFVPHNFTGNNKGAPNYQLAELSLRRITSWSANTQMMINGFVWEGDYGIYDGQVGLADGYVADNGTWLGTNRLGGGVTGWQIVDQSGGNKLALGISNTKAFNWGESAQADAQPVPGLYVMSSSTSILKAGVCSSDTTVNRWSAVGTTPNGRIIFVSSISDGQTSAAELCAVFKALGANYAMRLDGGPSAAMTMNGSLLNPLTGQNSFKYGVSRHIAYALKISYPGW